ncbi:MAG: hypothetical protein Kow0068_15690 [Marinilabiliales bacterium]
MKICIAGKNQIAVNALRYLIEIKNISKKDLMVCINKTDDGKDSWQPSLKLFAVKNKIKLVTLDELYLIKNLIFISLEFDKIIRPQKFLTKQLYNIHFSLLPAYKGMYTSVFPILNGEKYYGVTLHLIDDGIDTGDIIDQEKFEIDINDTCRDLYFKYLEFGEKIFKKNISNILDGKITAYKQSAIGSSYYSKLSINFKKIEINFNKTSFEIHNQIRAFIFKEYQLPEVFGKKVKKSLLTNERISRNYRNIIENKIILSGIDGYKIICETT